MDRSKSIVSLLNVDLRTLIITYNTTQFITLNLSSTRRRPLSSLAPPPPPRAAAAAARLRRKIVSGRFDEEDPFVQNSVLLVQPDEGVSVLVVERIGDYLPQSTEKSRVLVIPVGARHKCQQGIRFERHMYDDY
ncbi:far upstream element-binding protein 2-like [Dorcoceras hygrometricum]|uniref:Far upstream element-binding protein 2-like n=1 Tax=Dorcoceras hygrometricum TaxID=472368 RepID=A0A2Z6ZYJ7_9LAMI|nr:far upstream element-binding protein 2-like [Dorcoceras hygrometricum]